MHIEQLRVYSPYSGEELEFTFGESDLQARVIAATFVEQLGAMWVLAADLSIFETGDLIKDRLTALALPLSEKFKHNFSPEQLVFRERLCGLFVQESKCSIYDCDADLEDHVFRQLMSIPVTWQSLFMSGVEKAYTATIREWMLTDPRFSVFCGDLRKLIHRPSGPTKVVPIGDLVNYTVRACIEVRDLTRLRQDDRFDELVQRLEDEESVWAARMQLRS